MEQITCCLQGGAEARGSLLFLTVAPSWKVPRVRLDSPAGAVGPETRLLSAAWGACVEMCSAPDLMEKLLLFLRGRL